MRIAQVALLTEAVPPRLYGGTERVVQGLRLVALGNDVTLFASGDSQTPAKLDVTWPKALRLDGSVRDANALHMVMLERLLQKCDDEEFDFLHFHLDYYPFSLFSRQPTPFLTTLHGRLRLGVQVRSKQGKTRLAMSRLCQPEIFGFASSLRFLIYVLSRQRLRCFARRLLHVTRPAYA